MHKRWLCAGVLAVLLVLLLLAIGCNGKETGEVTEGGTPATEDTPITVVYGGAFPPESDTGLVHQAWMDKIVERSEGRVQFETHWMWSLIPAQEEAPKGVKEGIADIHAFFWDPSLTPVNYGLENMPFMGWPSREAILAIWHQLHEEFPVMSEELSKLGVKMYGLGTGSPNNLGFTNKVVRVPEDIKGMPIHVWGPSPFANLLSKAGATPVELGFGDIYTGFDTGIVEGGIGPATATDATGVTDFMKHVTVFGDTGFGVFFQFVIINPEFYNNLPEDIRQIFDELEPFLVEETIRMQTELHEAIMDRVANAGHTITELTPEEIKLWEDLATSLHEEWIEEMEAKGVPARAIYDRAKQLIEEYK